MCIVLERFIICFIVLITDIQVGLASIKQRMIREIGKYGLNPKFTEVDAHNIQQMSQEIKKR